VHSPVGNTSGTVRRDVISSHRTTFASNDVSFTDATASTTARLRSTQKALYNYMHGIGLDLDVRDWFEQSRLSRVGNGARRARPVLCRAQPVPPILSSWRWPERARVLIAFNKPFGVACKFTPEPGRKTLADYIA